jgi:hypothetical protein
MLGLTRSYPLASRCLAYGIRGSRPNSAVRMEDLSRLDRQRRRGCDAGPLGLDPVHRADRRIEELALPFFDGAKHVAVPKAGFSRQRLGDHRQERVAPVARDRPRRYDFICCR